VSRTRPSDAAVEQRRQEILDHVVEAGEARIDDLTARFRVSLMTMHRDLDDLAERGLLRKLRGKVAAFPTLTRESADTNSGEKEALGEAAARQVRPGQTVFIDDSTTLFPLVRRLAAVEGLTVITNSLQAELLHNTRADVAFVSVTAVAVGRLFHPVREYADLKRAVLQAANHNVLVVDHSKFGRTATYAHGTVGDYDLLITSEETPTEEIEAALNAGVALEIVEHVDEGQPYDS